jgi:hypothetical protein
MMAYEGQGVVGVVVALMLWSEVRREQC